MATRAKIRGYAPTDHMNALGVTGVFFNPLDSAKCQIEYVSRESGELVTEIVDQHIAHWIVGFDEAVPNG